ncbi:unnamed protein product [Cunninghamella blakesleeana]
MESIRKWAFNDTMPSSNVLANEEDCFTCISPCEEHQQYPSYLDIKTDRNIASTVKPYERHILIATGKSDWPKHIEDDDETIAKALLSTRPGKSTMITNTSLITTHSTDTNAQDLIILPENILVANVTSKNVDQLWSYLENNSSLPSERKDVKEYGHLMIKPSPYSALILLCSHRKRDKRCGVTAPILAREFDHVLRNINDSENMEIVYVSHIGGHKIAGNVILYTDKLKGIWYGLVKTCHVQAIVEQSIENGKIIQSIYRGCMSNALKSDTVPKKSLFSW